MKNILFSLIIIVAVSSCKLSGENSISESSLNYPKIHYSSTEHNVGAPISFIFQHGTYSLFYNGFNLDKKVNNQTYVTTSKDLIHWQPGHEIEFSSRELNILKTTIVLDPKTSVLSALIIIDPDKIEDNNNCYFLLSKSNNQGKTWSECNDRINFPIPIKNDFNPTLIWDEIHGKWILTIIDDQIVKFFSSSDLKKWTFECSLEKELQYHANIWNKATVFPINKTDWVILIDQEFVNPRDGSSVQYFIGSFDGQKFTTPVSTKSHWLDYGKDNIFDVVCQGLPANSAPLVTAWKNNADYVMIGSMQPFWGSFTIPRSLSLTDYSGEKILAAEPIQAINTLKKNNTTLTDLDVSEKLDISTKIPISLSPSLITLIFETTDKTRMTFPSSFGILLENDKSEKLIVGYDSFKEWYFIDRTDFISVNNNSQFKGMDIMPCYHSDSLMVLKMIIDDSSMELFTEKGKLVMTDNFNAQQRFNKVTLFAENGIIKVKTLSISNLESIKK